MQVEVNIQDYFSAALLGEVLEGDDPAGGIASPLPGLEALRLEYSQLDQSAWEAWFRHWLTDLQTLAPAQLPNHPTHAYEVSLRLTTDAEIQTLNAQYRQINQPTDVLAFATLEVDYPQLDDLPDELSEALPLYLGDIVISVETAHQQAQQQEHSLQTELVWLATHGLLHLLGWDHPDDETLLQMLNQQRRLLQSVGLIASPA